MKFGLREVCNVVLKARKDGTFLGKEFKKGQPVLWFDSLKTSGLEGSGEIIYARGGRGNTKLVSWTGDREVTFTMEDALISPMSMALLTAGSLSKAGSENKIISHRTVEVKASQRPSGSGPFQVNSEDLPKDFNIKSNYPISVIAEVEGVQYVGGAFSNGMEANSIGIWNQTSVIAPFNKDVATNVAEGATPGYYMVTLDYYVEKTSEMIQIDISPDSFGAGFYLEGETLFREYGEGGYDQAAEFIVPNCRVQSNFNFSMASTGDPSTFTFTMDAFPAYLDLNSTAGDKVLCAIQVFEEEKKEGGN